MAGKGLRRAVRAAERLWNAPRSERFKELDLFSLEKRLRDYFHTVCKCLYRNKNLVIESSLSDENPRASHDG